jgi:alpha-glucosidase
VPWENGPPGFGFTTGTPWLPMPETWQAKTVERQRAEEGSTLSLYRAALALHDQLRGDLEWDASPHGTLVFGRGDIVCAVNVDGAPLTIERTVLLASEPVHGVLPPGAAAWLR